MRKNLSCVSSRIRYFLNVILFAPSHELNIHCCNSNVSNLFPYSASNNEKWMAGSVRVLSEEEGEDQGEEENVVARQLWKGKGESENHEV